MHADFFCTKRSVKGNEDQYGALEEGFRTCKIHLYVEPVQVMADDDNALMLQVPAEVGGAAWEQQETSKFADRDYPDVRH